MSLLINLITVVFTVILMECMSWFIHKYLFHGPLWFIHKSHHERHNSFLEWNDVFAILFAALSLYLMFIDRFDFGFRFFIGLGITLYGLIYFVIHDWFVHQRIRAFKTKNAYLSLIRKAHKIHHKNQGKENGKAFGLLFVKKNVVKASSSYE
ncbi:beta-carotene 3-hydroxylase [Pedobacter rhizosphaerae]|uniref:Beta-carotene 3-hydroxylase n=2 Tax=Pedobacter rhizosphaerae TaxID=390241 RepID=A0A1H9VZT5_9SPHI|nr:beta-carotene 3-hydroxylase [Pedobacter rhizosphaerae]